ncbi:Single-stranded DNA-binding protein B [Sporomusa rhizae]|uniref:single-stranded DNA-binding protein n=1 Tax=Sporomusa rhizae TaxID=357999 RepID=UPI003529FE96
MNQVSLVGRLAQEPEIFYSKEGKAVAKYRLAVPKMNKKEADFIQCVSFGKTAETIGNYVTKGQQIGVTGRIDTGKYTTREGQTRYYTQVIVPTFTFGAKPQTSSHSTPISEEIPF